MSGGDAAAQFGFVMQDAAGVAAVIGIGWKERAWRAARRAGARRKGKDDAGRDQRKQQSYSHGGIHLH